MDIQAIWNAIQPDVFVVILAAATYVATSLYQWSKQQLPDNLRKQIDVIAQMATKAVEQKYANVTPGSTAKKQEALGTLMAICSALKIPLDISHANAAIEAAVYEINLFKKAHVSQTPTTPMQTVAPIAPPVGQVPPFKSKPLAAG